MNERPNPIFLNAGDHYQGTLWYNVHRWNVTATFMNMLPHDVMVKSFYGIIRRKKRERERYEKNDFFFIGDQSPGLIVSKNLQSIVRTQFVHVIKWNFTLKAMKLNLSRQIWSIKARETRFRLWLHNTLLIRLIPIKGNEDSRDRINKIVTIV